MLGGKTAGPRFLGGQSRTSNPNLVNGDEVIEEVDHNAVVSLALFAGRRRQTETTQRQIRSRLTFAGVGKQLCSAAVASAQWPGFGAGKQQHALIANGPREIASGSAVVTAQHVDLHRRA